VKATTTDVERFRVRDGMLGTTRAHGFNGVFAIPYAPPRRKGIQPARVWLQCIASDGGGWEHVSVVVNVEPHGVRTPTWEEMDAVKRMFWRDTETVMQLHVPRNDHVNQFPHCLHLWRPQFSAIPLPPVEMV